VRLKCNRCGKPQSRPLDIFNRNIVYLPENLNNFSKNDFNDLNNQTTPINLVNNSIKFNNFQNKIISPQNKFNSMRNFPYQGFDEKNKILNPQNRQKFGLDNNIIAQQYSQSQILHTQGLNNLNNLNNSQMYNENLFNNLTNYYNNNQGNENFSILKNSYSKNSCSNLNSGNKPSEIISSNFPNIVQPAPLGNVSQNLLKNPQNIKEGSNVNISNQQIHGTFLYPCQGNNAQNQNNFANFGNYSNCNSFNRDNNSNSKNIFGINKNLVLNKNLLLNANPNSNIKNPVFQDSNSNILTSINGNNLNIKNNIINNQNLNSNFQELQNNIGNGNSNYINNQAFNNNMNMLNNKNIGNLCNNPLSQLGGNIPIQNNTTQNLEQQQKNLLNLNLNEINLQNNINTLNNNILNQNSNLCKMGNFGNINFANDFKKKYTPLDNLRLQNPSLNILNSPQINTSLNLNRDYFLNQSNNNIKSKIIGVNNLFEGNLEDNLKNLNLDNKSNLNNINEQENNFNKAL